MRSNGSFISASAQITFCTFDEVLRPQIFSMPFLQKISVAANLTLAVIAREGPALLCPPHSPSKTGVNALSSGEGSSDCKRESWEGCVRDHPSPFFCCCDAAAA